MKTDMRAIGKLRPHPKNPKLHTDEQIEQIKNSIKEFGFTQPVVIDEKDTILIGHGRTKAAKLAGLKQVPVEKIALCLADNLLAQETEMDEEILNQILREINSESFTLAEALGLKYEEPEVDQSEANLGVAVDEGTSGSIGQIVILMESKDFDEAMRKFDVIREKHPKLQDNTAVFSALLDNYENG